MFGFVHDTIYQMITQKYGKDFWENFSQNTTFEVGTQRNLNHYYADKDTFELVDSIANFLEIPASKIWEMYGAFLIQYTMEIGWEGLLQSISSTLEGFLTNLDGYHYFVDHYVYKANLNGPGFRCETGLNGSIILHYFSYRPGLYPIVEGVIKEAALKIYKINVEVTILSHKERATRTFGGKKIQEHVTFGITNPEKAENFLESKNLLLDNRSLKITEAEFHNIFPFQIVIDRECKIVRIGNGFINHVSFELLEKGNPLSRVFEIIHPHVDDFDGICQFLNTVFVLQVRTKPIPPNEKEKFQLKHGIPMKFKGQMFLLDDGKHLLYLCSPQATSFEELMQFEVKMNIFSENDPMRDVLLANEQRLQILKYNIELEGIRQELEKLTKNLEAERTKNDALLQEVIPTSISQFLTDGNDNCAKEFKSATVMFTDLPRFQEIVPKSRPNQIVDLLNEIFLKFDRIIDLFGINKIGTIGDSYMTVCGVPEIIDNHCERICHAAFGMLWEARSILDPVNKKPVIARAGIHTGSVVSGIIGKISPRLYLFGKTVTIASKMVLNCPSGGIQCTNSVYDEISQSTIFEFINRGNIEISESGKIRVYFLKKSFKMSIWKIVDRENGDANSDGYSELWNEFENNWEADEEKAISKTCTIS